jgi:predicted Zn-dependent peptidase
LGRPILGTEETIGKINREAILSFWKKHYAGENIVLSAAGNIDHQELIKYAEKYFKFSTEYLDMGIEPVTSAGPSTFLIEQPINQAHLCIGGESVSYKSEARFPLMIINTYLGGGMSSRLFQQIRERRGLAYSIYSFLDFYSDIGLFGIYAGTDVVNIKKVETLVRKELKNLSTVPISRSALLKVKNQLKGNLLLSLESTSRRMSRLARNEIYYGDYVSLDELIQRIDRVDQAEILKTAMDLLQPDNFTTVVLKPKN